MKSERPTAQFDVLNDNELPKTEAVKLPPSTTEHTIDRH